MESISRFWEKILDAIFGSGRDRAAAEEIFSVAPLGYSDGPIQAALPYRDPQVRKALWLFKYRGNKVVAEACAGLLFDIIVEEMEEEILMEGNSEILLVPIPSSSRKKRTKGFNQTEILAKLIAQKDKTGRSLYRNDVLYKIKDTEAQAKIRDKKKRLKNLIQSMEARPEMASGKTIFLIDDVTTTGATFKEAIRALDAAGAKKILCFAIAH